MNSLAALFLISLPCAILADDFQGDIYSLDAKANSVTLSSKKGMKTYRVRPNTEITINGVKGKFDDLNTGMTAKVVSADPSIASRIVALGTPNRPGGTDNDPGRSLAERLRNTRWKLSDTDGATFTLHTDGSTNLSRHNRKGTWKVIAGNTIELSLWKEGGPDKVTVNPEATNIRWLSGNRSAKRIAD